jgi:hypothetical protein
MSNKFTLNICKTLNSLAHNQPFIAFSLINSKKVLDLRTHSSESLEELELGSPPAGGFAGAFFWWPVA